MIDPIFDLLRRYRSRGVLVDANILLLYFVGSYDRARIPRFKRTQVFTVEDYDLLIKFLAYFERIVTTPNILTEVSNFSGQLGEPARSDYFVWFAKEISLLDERYVESRSAAQLDSFPRLGLTDCSVMHLAQGEHLVLTDDFNLYQSLQHSGIDAVNFNHLRASNLLG